MHFSGVVDCGADSLNWPHIQSTNLNQFPFFFTLPRYYANTRRHLATSTERWKRILAWISEFDSSILSSCSFLIERNLSIGKAPRVLIFV